MKKTNATPMHIDAIKNQIFTDTIPGSLVKDINTLLALIETETLRLTHQKVSFASDILTGLNAKLTNPHQIPAAAKVTPINYPNLKGLYLLLRTSLLTTIEVGKGACLKIHKKHYAQWKTLNSAEQFMWLFESWFLRGYPEIIGEKEDFSRNITVMVRFGLNCYHIDWISNDGKHHFSIYPGYTNIAIMQLAGFIDVVENASETKERDIRKISLTDFGRSFFGLVKETFKEIDWMFEPEALISLFKLNCTDMKNIIKVPKIAHAQGSFIFEISLPGCKRIIELPAKHTLDSFFYEIIKAFDFDSNHLYVFLIKNSLGITNEYGHSYLDSCNAYANDFELGALELIIGQKFKLIYDFGDNWRFKIRLINHNPLSKIEKGSILEKKGKAPEQY